MTHSMRVELTAPSCLRLGPIQFDGQACELGSALQHPPIQLLARPATGLIVSGARADLAYRQAEQFLAQHQLPLQGEIEIELAIPAFMGLDSDAMLRLSVERALATLHGLPLTQPFDKLRATSSPSREEGYPLEAHAFAQGGLLLVDNTGVLLKRHAIIHQNEADDWVFVFVLPFPPGDIPETLEADHRAALHAAARYLGADAERIFTQQLWPAVENDDIAGFAQALSAIHALNLDALARAGQPQMLTSDEQAILNVMCDNGALAWGRALTGLGLYGLIKGGRPSRDLRAALTKHIGYFGGTVMATICDNQGARIQITR